ncbi:MAG: hypothetical protein RBS78_05755, partial [Coriobacteriia bacterium]|nr:hypothetical protein [Coriobacteriia bacterium]
MSESATGNRQVTILIAIAAVLLAAVVGIIVWQNSKGSSNPAAPAQTSGMPTQQPTATGAQAPEVEFDPATAPAVPEDQTPLEYLQAYYKACAANDYATAFKMLPVASQKYYGDVSGFEQTLRGYGITEFSVDEPVENGDTVSIIGWQVAQGMTFGYE